MPLLSHALSGSSSMAPGTGSVSLVDISQSLSAAPCLLLISASTLQPDPNRFRAAAPIPDHSTESGTGELGAAGGCVPSMAPGTWRRGGLPLALPFQLAFEASQPCRAGAQGFVFRCTAGSHPEGHHLEVSWTLFALRWSQL